MEGPLEIRVVLWISWWLFYLSKFIIVHFEIIKFLWNISYDFRTVFLFRYRFLVVQYEGTILTRSFCFGQFIIVWINLHLKITILWFYFQVICPMIGKTEPAGRRQGESGVTLPKTAGKTHERPIKHVWMSISFPIFDQKVLIFRDKTYLKIYFCAFFFYSILTENEKFLSVWPSKPIICI